MYEKLKELGDRLLLEGRKNDATIIFSAMVKFAPSPIPKYESIQKTGDYILFTRSY